MEGTNETKHPLATGLSQKYADSILMELPEKQSGLHRPNVEKMCAMLEIEAKTAAVVGGISTLNDYLRKEITAIDTIECLLCSGESCQPSSTYFNLSVRRSISDMPLNRQAQLICEAAMRYIESQKESAGRLESNG